MCMCKACVSCGGTPAVAASKGGCTTAFTISLDVRGRLELAVSHWKADEELMLQLPAGVSATPAGSQGGLNFGGALPLASGAANGAKSIVVPILGSREGSGEPTKLWYTLSGHAQKYEPAASCRLRAAPPPRAPPPLHPPVLKPPPPPTLSPAVVNRPPPSLPVPPPAVVESTSTARPAGATKAVPASATKAATAAHATSVPLQQKCTAPPDRITSAPLAIAQSSASWQLALPGVRPCTELKGAEWDVRIRRDGAETQAVISSGAAHVNASSTILSLVGVRCPLDEDPKGCSFSLRMRNPSTNATTSWSAESSAHNSKPTAAIPAGGARLEVLFVAVDPVWPRWEGSVAQRFQRFSASQMSVSERSVRVVERFADGEYLILDLAPVELGLTHMLERMLPALPRGTSIKEGFGIKELQRLLPHGNAETLFTASRGVAAAYAQATANEASFDSIPIAIAISLSMCLFLARSWHQQQQQYARAGGKGSELLRQAPMDRALDDDDDHSEAPSDEPAAAQVSVHFGPSCGEEMELLLPTQGVEDPGDLRKIIWQRGNALMPQGLPSEESLRISFSDARGTERPLTSATLLAQVFEAGRIDVSCSIERSIEVEAVPEEDPEVEERVVPSKPMMSGSGGGDAPDSGDDEPISINSRHAATSGGDPQAHQHLLDAMEDDGEAGGLQTQGLVPPSNAFSREWEDSSPRATPATPDFKAASGRVIPQQLLGVGLNAAVDDDDEFSMRPLAAKPTSNFGAYPLD